MSNCWLTSLIWILLCNATLLNSLRRPANHEDPCEPPKRYTNCGMLCLPTCKSPRPGGCGRSCTAQRCICPRGMVQLSQTDRTCLLFSDCPKCKHPAIPIKCSEECPESCDGIKTSCVRNCTTKYVCGCPESYILKTINGTECIKPEECPPKCPAPKIYKECPFKCQPTCENQEPNLEECGAGCREDTCVCPRGFVLLNKESGKCVESSQCPTECDPPLVSRRGCGTACPATCDDPIPLCNKRCVPENSCVCPEGLVQRSATDKTCVTLTDCLSRMLGCRAPALPMLCDSTCPKSCEATSPTCTRTCKADFYCGCPEGYILKTLDGGECVRPEQCPPKCQEPKVYEECASICQPTCQLPNPASCRRGCSEKVCVCPNGMVELSDESSICVYLSECPTECDPPLVSRRGCGTACPATCDMRTSL